jgi:hypothetical protein
VELPEERPLPKPRRDLSGNAANGAVERFMTVLNLAGFDALEAFRLLGSMMRARAPAYRVCTEGGKAAPEPIGFA